MSYNSKHKGSEVEELLDSIGNKVDKVDGKQLSTEDFTTLLKQKLDGLSNYDDTAIQESVSKLRTDLDTLVSGDTTTAIKTFNEVIAFLDGLEDTEDLASIIASIEHLIAAKQDSLVSGTNIKTVNGQSILGSGDLVIESVSDDIYYWGFVELSGELEGIVTAEEFEKIKKCSVLVQRIIVDGHLYSSTIYTYKLDTALLGVEGIMFTANNTIGDNRLTTTIIFNPNEDGSANYVITNSDLYTFKTINGESILGEGDITIEGGSVAYAEVSHGTSDTTFTLTPNTFHVWDEVASLDLSFGEETSGVANEFLFQFTSGATATTLTLPDTVEWVNGALMIEADKTYQISIVNNIGLIISV